VVVIAVSVALHFELLHQRHELAQVPWWWWG